ncbi:MAG: bile acid:sodium symporter family protein [Sphaerochaeta sp.]|nr:bile acid:sodium symporter family protein [Sphaerochaeta sp.]
MFHFQKVEARLKSLNYHLERFMPLLTPSGVIMGLLLGSLVSWMTPSVPYLFGLITFIGGLGISSNAFFGVIKKPKAILFFILGANIIMPLVAWALANLLFPGHPAIITGFILLMAIPTAITGYIWANIYRGNGALSLTLIIVSTLLAPFLTPYTVAILAQTSVQIDTKGMMISLLIMVVIPSIVGILINNATQGKVNDHMGPNLKPFSKIGLFFIIVINTSNVAERLIADASWIYLPIALVCALLAVIGYPLAHYLGKIAGIALEDRKSVTFAVSMRNISSALVLAIAYFPPETALPVIFGIVFQQTICAFMAHTLYGRKKIT